MKIYFCSSIPAVLTLNELYFGVTDTFERFIDVSLKENIFVRFTPQNALPVSFFLTEDIRFTAPKGVEVYLLRDGIALYARDFPPSDFSLRPLAQIRENNLLATLFFQGDLQLSLTTEKTAFVATLPPRFSTATLSYHNGFVFVETETSLAVYNGRAECVFMEDILSFTKRDNGFTAILRLCDSLNRTAECSYILNGDTCIRETFILRQAFFCEQDKLELIPFAFFESVLIGANFETFLSDELLAEKDKIVRFLGDFSAVILTEDPNTCGLLKRCGKRIFEACYYTVTLKDYKILDIRA